MRKFYILTSLKESIRVFDKPENFNLNTGCPKCGTGANRLELIINKTQKSEIDCTVQGDLIISERVISEMKKNGFYIDHFQKVKLNKELEDSGFFHLNGEYVLPKMLSNSRGIISSEQCQNCGQNGFYDTLTCEREYHYQMNDLFKTANVLSTWEHFGPSIIKPTGNRIFRLARPRILISEDLKAILEKLKYSKIKLEEIYVEK